jgi:chorismate mutase/prephenate dehydratase
LILSDPAMSKKPTSSKPAGGKKPGSARPATISGLEAELRRADRHLVRLISDRAQTAQRLAAARTAAGQPALSLAEEEALIAQAAELNKGPLPEEALRAVYREIISGVRSLVRQMRVAFLGPIYSYSHLAAIHRFGHSAELAPVGTIAAVFEEVERGQSEFGLVPIENSTDGRIADTLDMFTRLPVRICGEVHLEIHHTLLGRCPRTEVKEVYSRPQALSQCRNWLARHMPAARTVEVTSTTTAAQIAKEKPGAAAIASMEAGVHYGLDVLAANIEDDPGNTTRFAVIGKNSAQRTGSDRTAVMFQTEHRFGALADALAVFKRYRLNLTWIESFPAPEVKRTYLFFVELEGHEADIRVRKAIAALERRSLRLRVLGSFPVET